MFKNIDAMNTYNVQGAEVAQVGAKATYAGSKWSVVFLLCVTVALAAIMAVLILIILVLPRFFFVC